MSCEKNQHFSERHKISFKINKRLFEHITFSQVAKLNAIPSKVPVEIFWGKLMQIPISNGRGIFKMFVKESLFSHHLV